MAKRKLEPLIPEDELKAVLQKLIAVPKSEIAQDKKKRSKRKRKKPANQMRRT